MFRILSICLQQKIWKTGKMLYRRSTDILGEVEPVLPGLAAGAKGFAREAAVTAVCPLPVAEAEINPPTNLIQKGVHFSVSPTGLPQPSP